MALSCLTCLVATAAAGMLDPVIWGRLLKPLLDPVMWWLPLQPLMDPVMRWLPLQQDSVMWWPLQLLLDPVLRDRARDSLLAAAMASAG